MGKLSPSFSPFPQPGNGKISSYIPYLDTKVYVKKIKWPFWVFHWGHIVPYCQLYSVKANFNCICFVKTVGNSQVNGFFSFPWSKIGVSNSIDEA